jgi:deoxycytidine triphosphate deaminase
VKWGSPNAPVLREFSLTDPEAEARFADFHNQDPFPRIQPALLNSADLLDYIETVGILSPYEVTEKKREDWLKPASCAVGCTGEVLRFDVDPQTGDVIDTPVKYEVAVGKRLELKPNSITFLHLGTTFRIPNYIAARFNLAIREIHRGILVGTGPLVDPGFVGRLFIPLHNLTSNEYSVEFGEPLVWVEFTKLSPNKAWRGGREHKRRAVFVPFPKRKNDRKTPEHYLDHAFEGNPIASSIPKAIVRAGAEAEGARSAAESARSQVEKFLQRLRNIGIATAIATAVTILLAVVLPMYSLISDTNDRVDGLADAKQDVGALKAQSSRAAASQATLQWDVADLRAEVRRLRAELNARRGSP